MHNDMRGISFKVEGTYSKQLASIFDEIDTTNYSWIVTEDEILITGGILVEVNSPMDGSKFSDFISIDDTLIIFINLKAYPSNIKEFASIMNYDNFKQSDCQFILFCSDTDFYEIYCKDEKMIDTLKNNAIKNGFCDIEYITDQNDCRTVFSVI